MNGKITDKLLIIYVLSIYLINNNFYTNLFFYGGFFVVLIFGLFVDYIRGK